MNKEFKHDGQHYVYDLNHDACSTQRVMMAHQIWAFQQTVFANPPTGFAQLEATGATSADITALSHLLVELDEDGEPVRYDGDKSIKRAFAFISNLPARHYNELMECKEDFFAERQLYNVGSLKQLAALYGASMNGAVAGQLLKQAALSGTDEPSLSDDSESTSSSTPPENSLDASISETPTAPTTGGATASSSAEPGGKSTE